MEEVRLRLFCHLAHLSSPAVMNLLIIIALVFFLLLLQNVQCEGDWVQMGKPKHDYKIKVTFAIKQTNPGWLGQKLKEVSYPSSPQYGEYLNFDEIAVYVHGRPESVNALISALNGVGIGRERIDFTLGMDFAVVHMPVDASEKLFSANFYEFQHKEKSEWRVVKSLDYTLPAVLDGHLDFVHGMTNFPQPNRQTVRQYDKAPGLLGFTPDSIAKDFNTSSYVSTNPDNSQAVAGFIGQYFSPNDLKMFQEKYNVPINLIAKVEGPNDPSNPGLEASLDVEYITATGRNVTTWFVNSNHFELNPEVFLSWITGQVNDTKSPWVHSCCYYNLEKNVDVTFAERMENEFMKFGISGRTVLIASGDFGVGCSRSGSSHQYTTEWPVTSPSITAVGGTTNLNTVWELGGGGFSNLYPTPDYQKDAVQAYLNSGEAPPTTYFNISGRAYPDVAAYSVHIPITISGFSFNLTVAGTSASAPIFAGLVASLNDIRLNKGQKTLGFLNPLLYQTLKGKGFFDVTKGINDGGDPSCDGFKATTGWDPASGWGNPNFGILKDLV